MAKKFVCVRMQSMNGVNLDLFQFEYDLTFMAFFMDAHDHFYTRYGAREDDDPESHLTQKSLARVMRQVLALHQTNDVQKGRYEPQGKKARTPEDIPPMNKMLARRKVKCIHCHDVKVAQLRQQQAQGTFERSMVFTYPTAERIGLRLSPDDQQLIQQVLADSPASAAGIRAGDRLVAADTQRVLTLADLSRVLELTPKKSQLPLKLQRDGQPLEATLTLSGTWRQNRDPSWRESLHVAGPNAGIWGRALSAEEKAKRNLGPDALGVKVMFLYGQHSKAAGIKLNDVVVAVDGIRRAMTIKQLHAHLQLHRDWGDTVEVVVYRDGREKVLSMKLPEKPAE